jgi:hypothetical protein
MSKPATSARDRLVEVNTATAASAPTNNSTLPHIVLPARGPGGDPCAGFSFSLHATSAGAATGPFTVTCWRLVGAIAAWASFESIEDIGFAEQYICYDLGAGQALYFQIVATTNGQAMIAVGALS